VRNGGEDGDRSVRGDFEDLAELSLRDVCGLEVKVKGALSEHDIGQRRQRPGIGEVAAVSNVINALVGNVENVAGHERRVRVN
jgi:hypothetical protein